LTTAAALRVLNLEDNQLEGAIPEDLGRLTSLTYLNLQHNQLSGSMPPSIGLIKGLAWLRLCGNHLEGEIPEDIGQLSSLRFFCLAGNKFSGQLTSKLLNCRMLEGVDLRYNGVEASDPVLAQLISDLQVEGEDWALNQTLPPTKLEGKGATSTSVMLSWTPIAFSDSPGYYEIYGAPMRQPNTLLARTASKTDASVWVAGLVPGTTYTFVIRSVSLPHEGNKNTLVSLFSERVAVRTVDAVVSHGR
jgi:hypothetical protein